MSFFFHFKCLHSTQPISKIPFYLTTSVHKCTVKPLSHGLNQKRVIIVGNNVRFSCVRFICACGPCFAQCDSDKMQEASNEPQALKINVIVILWLAWKNPKHPRKLTKEV